MECLSVLVQRKQWKISISSVVLLRLGIFFAFYLVYIALGALIFWALEGPNEYLASIHLYEIRQAILSKNPAIETDLDEFEDALKQANGIRNYVIYNETFKPNWSFGNSVFFVGTLLTTIGYGNIAPQTAAGKVFTIVYATMGIPMTLLLLSAFVEKILVIVMSLLLWLDSKLYLVYGSLLIRLIHLAIVLFAMAVGFLVVPATIISQIEPQWNILDAFYYCFTSLTTIGLGDLIPGDFLNNPNRDLYKIVITTYLYAGCTAMMLVMAVIYDIPEIQISRFLSNMTENTGNTAGGNNHVDRGRIIQLKIEPHSHLDRDKVMEKARLSRTSLGLGLTYGLDWDTVSTSSNLPRNVSAAVAFKNARKNTNSIE